ncbi:MAG: nitrogenase cofactor biosynthesis protein NifB [Magnetococcales bacterium]|nr:nitrogenase cofactor biosynthesis protein NifB [Magnetococcales bacterium]
MNVCNSTPAPFPSSLTEDHPCYSEEASHRYARMHLAVAPACNIQCRYCNRKFDCANESRPGVVSGLLTPEQAVARTRQALIKLPNLRVIGIAGPGDPLANPGRVFATCSLLREMAPELHLCLSTNGLYLLDHVDKIVGHGIRHVTITLNTLDPTIGAEIYSWVYWNKRRWRGVEAARILLDRQLAAVHALTRRDVLVKINSVLIPGINDEQIPAIHQWVSQAGVFSHNVMPLISAAEHGTYYGVTGVRGPSEQELQDVRSQCQGSARLMTHCRQCRADAAGLLAMDRHEDLTLPSRVIPIHIPASPPMMLAVASQNGELVDTHFGHARAFLIYQVTGEEIVLVGQREVPPYCHGEDHCVEEEGGLAPALGVLKDCQGVICARIGYTPWQALAARGITPVNSHANQPVMEALRLTANRLRQQKTQPVSLAC